MVLSSSGNSMNLKNAIKLQNQKVLNQYLYWEKRRPNKRLADYSLILIQILLLEFKNYNLIGYIICEIVEDDLNENNKIKRMEEVSYNHFDFDGVFTNNKVYVDQTGKRQSDVIGQTA